jgi:hypothetical protein
MSVNTDFMLGALIEQATLVVTRCVSSAAIELPKEPTQHLVSGCFVLLCL